MVTLNEKTWSAYREAVDAMSREALAKVDLVAAIFDRRLNRPDVVPAKRNRPASNRRPSSRRAAR